MAPRDFTGCLHQVCSAGACLGLVLCCACNKDAEKGQQETQSPESFEQREARLDATVWRGELEAQRHERTFVALRDELRKATNKLAVLERFDFHEIALPQAVGGESNLILGIIQRQFADDSRKLFSHAGWQELLGKLEMGGWELQQAEWNHIRFKPASGSDLAESGFEFELDAEMAPANRRAIIRGNLAVEWERETTSTSLVRPRRLTVSNLQVWERANSPRPSDGRGVGGEGGFRKSFVATPEAPERRGDFINMHPLIVNDVNGDGNDDIILAGCNRLFLNRGGASFQPAEFIAENVFHGVRSAGVLADFTGDGVLDFLTVAGEGVWSNKLVLYAGTGTFPFTNESVLACPTLELQDPSVLTAGDIDGDGDLDVFLAQYKAPYVGGQVPTPYYDANDGYPATLLLNDGHGRFSPATESAGLAAKRFRRTYAASFVDLNGDGDLDLVTLNDFAGVDLYYNNGKGVFTDETGRLYNRHLFGMSHCVADFDGDGALDLFAVGMNLPAVQRLESMRLAREDLPDRTRMRVEMAYGNRLYVQRSGQWFSSPFAAEIARTGWSWGVTACDFDNNGTLDLYLANGHVSGESSTDYDSHYWRHDIYVGSSRENKRLLYYFAEPFMGLNTGKTSWSGYQHNVLFLNTGGNHYLNAAFLLGVAHESDCRAVVGADLDNDGRMDLVLTAADWMGGPTTGRHRLLVHLNELPREGHWIGAKLMTCPGRPSPIGAKVIARSADRSWIAQIITGSSFQAQHPNSVHFGLGKVTRLTELTVHWPNGEVQRIPDPAVDRYYRF